MAPIAQGSIVRATVNDENGRNPKCRPLVIISLAEDIAESEAFAAVAIKAMPPDPVPSDCVALPWHRSKHPRTGLSKACVAKCTWIVKLTTAEIERVEGVVPVAVLREILSKLPDAM